MMLMVVLTSTGSPLRRYWLKLPLPDGVDGALVEVLAHALDHLDVLNRAVFADDGVKDTLP